MLREIEPHFNEERSYHELREEFRAQNLQRIRSLLKDYHIVSKDGKQVALKMMGEPLALQGGTTPAKRAELLDKALCEPVSQDFGLAEVPDSLWQQVEKLAEESMLSTSVTWEEGTEGTVDHEGPPMEKPIHEMSEPELIAYVDDAIEESKRRG